MTPHITTRPRKRRGLKLFVFFLLALPVAALVAIALCFDDEPRIEYEGELSTKSYEKAQRFIESHDPLGGTASGRRTLVATEEEVNLVANYAAKRFRQAATRIELQPGAAVVHASVPVASSPFGSWLNIEALVRETPKLPVVEKLKLGRVRVPAFLADYGLQRVAERLTASERGRIANDMISHVAISDTEVRVVYEWRPDLVKRALSTLTSSDDQARFRAYSTRLFETVESLRRTRTSVSIAQLMPPLFELAQERSAQSDAAKENRAALITLAFFANQRPLSTLIPAAASWPAPAPIAVTLYGRDDIAKHFVVSAALAIEGGGALTDAIGVHKEVDDARRIESGRTGFSFHDIVADKAGTRLGTLAVHSPHEVQRGLVAAPKESEFMPRFGDLAEGLSEAELKKRYGGVGGAGYNKVLADIDSRVANTPLLR